MEHAFSNKIRIFNKKDIETHISKIYRGLKRALILLSGYPERIRGYDFETCKHTKPTP
jgi:hypothetical protein